MKRTLFISQSRLSQNLMEIIVSSITQKIDFRTFDTIKEADQAYFPKPFQLIIIDHNALNLENTKNLFHNNKLSNSKKILLYTRKAHIDKELISGLGATAFLVKPFLPEELIELIKKKLGYEK